MKYTKSTNRVIAIINILTAVLNATLEQQTKGQVWRMLIKLLFHKFPVICKNAADSFYMYSMSHGDDEFGEDVTEEL